MGNQGVLRMKYSQKPQGGMANSKLWMIARIFRGGRKFLGSSQKKMAQDLHISQGALSKIEQGELQPSFEVLLRLVKLLNSDFSAFNSGIIESPLKAQILERAEYGNFKVPDKYAKNAMTKARAFSPFIHILDAKKGSVWMDSFFKSCKIDPDLFVFGEFQFSPTLRLELIKYMQDAGVLSQQSINSSINFSSIVSGKMNAFFLDAKDHVSALQRLGDVFPFFDAVNEKAVVEEIETKGGFMSVTLSVFRGEEAKVVFRKHDEDTLSGFCKYYTYLLTALLPLLLRIQTCEVDEIECGLTSRGRCIYSISFDPGSKIK